MDPYLRVVIEYSGDAWFYGTNTVPFEDTSHLKLGRMF